MLRVYSARIEPWDLGRVAQLASSVRALLLDVTWKTGGDLGACFAPSRAIFDPAYKAREKAKRLQKHDPSGAKALWDEAWATYEAAFLAEQWARYKANRAPYDRILAEQAVTVECYCADEGPPKGEGRCHRHLLRRRVFPMLGAVNAGELGVDYPAYRVAVTGTRPPRKPRGLPPDPAVRYAEEMRVYDKLAAVCRGAILGLDPGAIVVHGDADGMDSIARDTARARGLADEPHPPKPEEHGGDYRAACLARNVYVTTADRTLALPSPWSRGTWHAIGLSEKAGVKVERRWERVWRRQNTG